MVPQTESTLLSYFETGDTPTEGQFEELIRTMFYHYNDLLARVQAAEAAVVAVEASVDSIPVPVAMFFGQWATSDTPSVHFSLNINTAGITRSGGDFTANIPFTSALPDANYLVLVGGDTGDTPESSGVIGITKSTGQVSFSRNNGIAGNNWNNRKLSFVVYKL